MGAEGKGTSGWKGCWTRTPLLYTAWGGGHSSMKAAAWGSIPPTTRLMGMGVVDSGEGVLQGGAHHRGRSWVGKEEVPRGRQETPV